MKYIIGTGWWCTKEDKRNKQFLNGEDYIRSKEFHEEWARSVSENSSPDKVLVVDSCSPIKAVWDKELLPYEIVSLNKNAGHASSLSGNKYCGWMSSVLFSLEYASLCDCDYFVYVEQDALLSGKGIIEKCIEDSNNADFIFGKSEDLVQPCQQSFFLIKKSAIEVFCTRLRRIKYNDLEISPEVKFAIATSKFLFSLPHSLYVQQFSLIGKVKKRLVTLLIKSICSFKVTSFGYGRTRPINFDDEFYYFQHGSTEELEAYRKNSENVKK